MCFIVVCFTSRRELRSLLDKETTRAGVLHTFARSMGHDLRTPLQALVSLHYIVHYIMLFIVHCIVPCPLQALVFSHHITV